MESEGEGKEGWRVCREGEGGLESVRGRGGRGGECEGRGGMRGRGWLECRSA